MVKLVITKEYEVDEQLIDDLVCTALEGGINYWCSLAVIKRDAATKKMIGVPEDQQDTIEFAHEIISRGGTLVLHDVETEDSWELDREKFLNGLKKFTEDCQKTPEDLRDDHDANDADLIVQYAIFNEIVFG